MIDNRAVGKTIATLRQANGMTQQQLAAAMNVSHQAVSKWENGAALPDIQTMVELTQMFGITVEQLLSGEFPEARLEEESYASADEDYRTEDRECENKAEAEAPGNEKKESAANGRVKIDFKEILEMAPFMSKGAVSEMLERVERKLTAAEIARIAPFVEAGCLERLIVDSESEITWDSLRRLAPFLKKEAVDALARSIAMGEKYVMPEVNRMAEDVWKTMDDVSRRIEKGVDKAIRKVMKFGENAVNEVSKVFDDLTGDANPREERLARLRRRAFERAMDDGRWDWVAEHIDEVQDEELRRSISETANRQGMRQWVFEHLGGYADPETIDKAIVNEDWAWLGEHIAQFDGATQRRVASSAMLSEKWEWLSAFVDQIDLSGIEDEIACTARRAGAKKLAAHLAHGDVEPEQIVKMAKEAEEEGDAEFIGMIADVLDEETLCGICVSFAKLERWDDAEMLCAGLDAQSIETLMETAIGMGDFDAVDRMDALLRVIEQEDE